MASIREGLEQSAKLVLPRRGFLKFMGLAIAMPAIIRTAPLMPIKVPPKLVYPRTFGANPKMMWFNSETGKWEINGLPIEADFPPLYANHSKIDPEYNRPQWASFEEISTPQLVS